MTLKRFVRHATQAGAFTVTDDYTIEHQLGQGSYGMVCSAVHTPTGARVAIKQVRFGNTGSLTPLRLLREIKALKFCKHPNIITLYSIVEIPRCVSDTFNELYIVMDLMECDLGHIISRQGLSMEHIQWFLYQLLCGTNYIHSAGIIHRDLKPANVLVDSNCDLKICDFGLAREMSEEMTLYVETRWYRAPEVLMQSENYTTAIDIWSIGCIAAEMFLSRGLWCGKNSHQQLMLILQSLGTPSPEDVEGMGSERAQSLCLGYKAEASFSSTFADINKDGLELLRSLLTFHPKKRCTAKEALKFPFFDDYHDEDIEIEAHSTIALDLDEYHGVTALDMIHIRRLLYEEMLEFNKDIDINTSFESVEYSDNPSSPQSDS